jgi:hypothetical protein
MWLQQVKSLLAKLFQRLSNFTGKSKTLGGSGWLSSLSERWNASKTELFGAILIITTSLNFAFSLLQVLQYGGGQTGESRHRVGAR